MRDTARKTEENHKDPVCPNLGVTLTELSSCHMPDTDISTLTLPSLQYWDAHIQMSPSPRQLPLAPLLGKGGVARVWREK